MDCSLQHTRKVKVPMKYIYQCSFEQLQPCFQATQPFLFTCALRCKVNTYRTTLCHVEAMGSNCTLDYCTLLTVDWSFINMYIETSKGVAFTAPHCLKVVLRI